MASISLKTGVPRLKTEVGQCRISQDGNVTTSRNVDFGKGSDFVGEQRVLLSNVCWATYQCLLDDLADQSSPRLTYTKGTLEIMTPLPQHERLTYIIEMMITIFAAEVNVDVYCLRSTTFKREDLQRGFEPDSSFYIQHESCVRGKTTIDLRIDPPPDLVVEVDITSGSIDKFPIYSHLQVPEIWRHDGTELFIYNLDQQVYIESDHSIAFPSISAADATKFIQDSRDLSSTNFFKSLRKWIDTINSEQPNAG